MQLESGTIDTGSGQELLYSMLSQMALRRRRLEAWLCAGASPGLCQRQQQLCSQIASRANISHSVDQNLYFRKAFAMCFVFFHLSVVLFSQFLSFIKDTGC